MALNATFWTFSKRKNSTKRPAANTGTVISYVEKDVVSVLSPTIEIHNSAVLPFNYCYLAKYDRYYFVRDKRSIAYETYEVELEVDVPGSWGPSTYNQNVFAQMSSGSYDDQLDDDRVAALNPIIPLSHNSKALEVFPTTYDNPEILMSIITGSDGAVGGCDIFYNLDSVGNVLSFFDSLFDPALWKQIANTILSNSNPLSVINGIWAVPFNVAECHAVTTVTRNVDLGFANTQTVSGAILNGPFVKRHHGEIVLPAPSVSDFRFSERFVKYYVNIPFIGVVTIPTTLATVSEYLQYEYAADAISGMFSISLYLAGVCVGQYSTTLKTEFSLVSQSDSAASAVATGVKGGAAVALTGALKGGAKAALIGGIAGAAVGAFKGAASVPDMEQICSASGSLAPAAKYRREIETYLVENDSSVDPATLAATVGRPTQKVITLGANIGYVQTAAASVSFAGYESEIRTMNAMLDGGVYYE